MVYICAPDSQTTPGFTWLNDQTSGLYLKSTNQVAVACANTEIMTISASGVSTNGDLNFTGSLYQNGVLFGQNNMTYENSDNDVLDNTYDISIATGFNNSKAHAQLFVSIDGAGNDYCNWVATDSMNSIIMCGFYTGGSPVFYNSNNVSSGRALRAPTGGQAAYVTKYSSNGALQWFCSIDGSVYSYTNYNSDNAVCVTTDSSDNVIVSGGINDVQGTLYTYVYNSNNTSVGMIASPNNRQGNYVLKIDRLGDPMWWAGVDGAGIEGAGNVACDNQDSVYGVGLYGYVDGPGTVWQGSTGNLAQTAAATLRAQSGGYGGYLVKWNGDGIYQWHMTMDGAGEQHATRVTCSGSNIYVSGAYTNATSIYGTTNAFSGTTLRAPSGWGSYLLKVNSSGVLQWAVSVDGSANDWINDIATDGDYVYVCGSYTTNMTVYSPGNVSSGLVVPSPPANVTGSFVIKLNSSNGTPLWATYGYGSTGELVFTSVKVNSKGRVYASGYYTGTPTLYNKIVGDGFTTTMESLPATSGNTICATMIHFTSGGSTLLYYANIDGNNSDYITNMAIDQNDDLIVGGYYNSTNLTVYNSRGVASGLPNVRSTSGGTLGAFAVKYKEDNSYKLLYGAMDGSMNGDLKYFVNTQTNTVTLNLRDYANMSNIESHTLDAGKANAFLCYNGKWHELTSSGKVTDGVSFGMTPLSAFTTSAQVSVAQGTLLFTFTTPPVTDASKRIYAVFDITMADSPSYYCYVTIRSVSATGATVGMPQLRSIGNGIGLYTYNTEIAELVANTTYYVVYTNGFSSTGGVYTGSFSGNYFANVTFYSYTPSTM